MPRCICGERDTLDNLMEHCQVLAADPGHGIVTAPWQCGICGTLHSAGEDPAVWGESLPDGRISLPVCTFCANGPPTTG